MSRSRDIAKILGITEADNTSNVALLNTTSSTGLDSSQVSAIAGSGVTTYDSTGALPVSHTVGDQAFVTGVSRLYFSNGSGWYSQNIINANPRWADSVGSGVGEPATTYDIVDSATPLIVKAIGVDSDALPLTNSIVLADSAQYVFNMTQDSSVFTFTPKTFAQATASSVAGLIDSNAAEVDVTFKVTDGIAILSKPSIIKYAWNNTFIKAYTGYTAFTGNNGQAMHIIHPAERSGTGVYMQMGVSAGDIIRFALIAGSGGAGIETSANKAGWGLAQYTVPAGVTELTAYAGGAGQHHRNGNNIRGEGGTIGGGNSGLMAGTVSGNAGNTTYSVGCGGGGYSGLFKGLTTTGGTFANTVMLVGGSGGSGNWNSNTAMGGYGGTFNNSASAGGGYNGGGGGGGSTSTGGARGTNVASYSLLDGSAGSQLQGGTGSSSQYDAGGGGGAGYYGGGGGSGGGGYNSGGGGGGSGYLDTANAVIDGGNYGGGNSLPTNSAFQALVRTYSGATDFTMPTGNWGAGTTHTIDTTGADGYAGILIAWKTN